MKRNLSYIGALVLLLASVAQAQFLGYVSQQTVAPTQVFTNQAANLASSAFTNLGQSAHFLSYCNTGFAGTISLEASPDGTFSTPNTLASATFGQRGATDSTCHVLQAGGYFQTVRARISNYVSGSVNAWYTAIASPITFAPSGLGSNGPSAPIVCDNAVFVSMGPSSSAAVVAGLAGTSIYVCQIVFSFNGAITAGGAILLGAGSGACGSAINNFSIALTASTPQVFQVGGPLGAFIAEGGGQHLCMNTGVNGATVVASISFAQR